MTVKKGDRYRSADEDCGCEIEVTQPSSTLTEDEEDEAVPSCFCGSEMERSGQASKAQA